MEETLVVALEFLGAHGYVVVFLWMFADQAALPLPSIPLLVAAGALAATGQLDLATIGAVATIATVLADSLWYLLGRYWGTKAIGLVCRLSLEPDSCVATTRNAFGRFGPVTLVIAKYLPGVQTLAPASAGFVRVPWLGFAFLDLIGTLVFVVPFLAAGFYFQPQLFEIAGRLAEVGGAMTWMVIGIASIYAAVKAFQ
ncbi:MAG: DedA family protein, partial [Myxococcales bacterium]|nr:DedA family protein [Myxococcales bacterium]